MYWAMKKPSGKLNGASLNGPWRGHRRLADFEGVFEDGTELIVSKGKPTGWSIVSRRKGKRMYFPYRVIDVKLKKQKDWAPGVDMNTRTAEESQKIADDFIEVALGESWRKLTGGGRGE